MRSQQPPGLRLIGVVSGVTRGGSGRGAQIYIAKRHRIRLFLPIVKTFYGRAGIYVSVLLDVFTFGL